MGFMDKVKGLFGQAGEAAGDAAHKAKDVAGDAAHKAKDVAGDVVDKAKDVAEDVKDRIDGDEGDGAAAASDGATGTDTTDEA